MDNKNHHGKSVLIIAKQKGLTKTALSSLLNMSRQGLEYHLKREFWNKETLQEFATVLDVDVKEIVAKTTSDNSEDYKTKYFQLLETTNNLWQVIAQNGIKVPVNFSSVSGYATVYVGLFLCLY